MNDPNWDSRQQKLDASFLQSTGWALFQQALGLKTYELQDDEWSCMLIERIPRFGGSYLFAPYGPTVARQEILPAALKAIAAHGRQVGAQWVRVEPSLGATKASDFADILPKLGLKAMPAPKQVNPHLTRMLDLTVPEEELIAAASSSTRQRIRKELREPQLEYKTSTDPQDIPTFFAMLQTVSERSKATFYSQDFFMKQAATLMPGGMMRLELALKDGTPIAACIIHDFNHIATYTYAGSLPEARPLNATTLLLWHALANAKARGIEKLDLFGIAPEGADESHPWHNFTVFKRQFGGYVVQRGDTLDIPLGSRYRLYRTAVKASRLGKR